MPRLLRQWAVLVRYKDLGRLFAGTSVSALGSSISTVAIPLTAVVFLGASPMEMGVLGAVGFVPHLVLGLPAGVWIGCVSYRTTVVVSDLLRVVLLGAIPVLAVFDVLAMWHLYVVVLLAGVCGLFEMLAATSYLPSLVPREDLLQANSVLAQSSSVVGATGSALGGALVQLLTAPVAIVIDAISFLVSGICKRTIGVPGHAVEARADGARSGLWHGIAAGVRCVFGDSILRPLVLAATIGALAGQVQNVVLVLFLARELDLSPSLVGLAIAVGGVASVAGAVLAVPITERFGHGPTFMLGGFLAALAGFGLAFASGPSFLLLGLVFAARVVGGFGPPLYGINQVTIRQARSTPEMLDRVNATWRFLVFGMQPLGALIGGAAGGLIGLRETFVVASLVTLAGLAIALWSPLRGLRRLPDPARTA